MCGKGKEKNYSTVIRDIIMCYPEVQFLFDETFTILENEKRKLEGEDAYSFLNFLFWNEPNTMKATGNEPLKGFKKCLKSVIAEFHQFNLGKMDTLGGFSKNAVEKQFIFLLKGRNNMYDGSNLRHAIKEYKFTEKLHVKVNYATLSESRSEYAAVTVEEEYHQSMFNGYCLYANGYRVIPIMTASELRWINEKYKNQEIANKPLLIRDYDLQFIDEDRVPKTQEGKNEIDFIRKANKVYDSTNKIIQYTVLPNDDNPYWSGFDESKTFFVSKGEEALRLDLNYSKAMEESQDKEGNHFLKLRGIKKPLEGIYASMRLIPVVNERYNSSRDTDSFKTSREGGEHGCPLDIYGIARSMVQRAERYYKFGRPRLAALVAGEALEVLNGFHKSLMNQAYYILSVSENAMAMSLLGGNEEMLKKDVNIRLRKKVKEDVDRMIADPKDRYNLLYNIFNDCMLFCQEKEYFGAADEALSAMVHEKEGVRLGKWIGDQCKTIGSFFKE